MTTMRTPAEEAALAGFKDAATSDADPGYPHGAAFIPWQDTPQTDRVLWRYLHEGRPAVIVGTGDFDMLMEPIELGPIGRIRNELLRRITVEVSYRRKKAPPAPEIAPSEQISGGTRLSAWPRLPRSCMSQAATFPVRVLHHHEGNSWWAESPDVEGWSAAGNSYTEVVKLAEEGIPFALGDEAALEHYVPAGEQVAA